MVREPLQVVAQHSFGLERLAAAAGVRPLAGVVELVDPQQRAGEEELPAGDAVVALLSSVFGSLVAQQRARRDEALPAVLAAEGPLASVDPFVGPPRVVVGEGLLAVRALVALLLGVAQPVHLQVVSDGEALSAVVAGEGLCAHVEQRDVGSQVGRLGESLPAGRAQERPLSRMGDHVRLEVGRLGEPLPALGAPVRLQSGVRAVVQLQSLQAGETLAALGAVVVPQVLVGPLVAAHATQQLEGFAAGGAFVRLPVRVGDLVELQALRVAEGLAALEARQQHPALVGLAVEVEALVGDEHLVTDFAVVAFLALVHLQMLIELILLAEAIPAEPALEGFGTRVHPVVSLQVPLQCKGLVTVGALVGLLAIVDLLVDDEAHQSRVDLPALPALVGFLSLVASLVSIQVRLLVKTSCTLRAVDHLSSHSRQEALPLPLGTQMRMILCRERGQRSCD